MDMFTNIIESCAIIGREVVVNTAVSRVIIPLNLHPDPWSLGVANVYFFGDETAKTGDIVSFK